MEEGPRRETEEAVGGSSVDTMRTFCDIKYLYTRRGDGDKLTAAQGRDEAQDMRLWRSEGEEELATRLVIDDERSKTKTSVNHMGRDVLVCCGATRGRKGIWRTETSI